MTYTIRPIAKADISAITAIYDEQVRYGTASFELTPLTADQMSERVDGLITKGFPYIVIEEDGQLVGYAYAGPYRTRPAYRWVVENSIYVHKDARGKGYGKLLLQALIEESANKGFRQMVAVIGDSKNLGSVNVHKSCGFELIGTLKAMGWKHEQWLDTVYMQRALGEGAQTPADLDSIPSRLID